MELTFSWDPDKQLLTRQPDSPVCDREESMKAAAHVKALHGDDPVAAQTAKYEMAIETYKARDWFRPCTTLPGGFGPKFVREPEPADYRRIAQGLRDIQATGGSESAVARLLDSSRDAADASTFNRFVVQVTRVEGYNEGNCRPLLMAHAWLLELNPEGDQAAILLLGGLLREWYGISEPATEATARHAQARHHATNLRWLSAPWRRLWMSP
jgi:hypothetical protein